MAAAPHAGAHTEARFVAKNQAKSIEDVALHFRKTAIPHQAKSMAYATSTRANCRRWVKHEPRKIASRVGQACNDAHAYRIGRCYENYRNLLRSLSNGIHDPNRIGDDHIGARSHDCG